MEELGENYDQHHLRGSAFTPMQSIGKNKQSGVLSQGSQYAYTITNSGITHSAKNAQSDSSSHIQPSNSVEKGANSTQL